MSQMSQSPNIFNPSGAGSYQPPMEKASSIVSASTVTDIQEFYGQNDQQNMMNSSASTASTPLVDHHLDHSSVNHDTNPRQNVSKKNLKTEYKSNFTPFDQYVYNEVTDSFVKTQHLQVGAGHGNNVSFGHHGNKSGSNQDLSGNFDMRTAVSPVLQVGSFEPLNKSDMSHNCNEPWYKEVIKRNEKANEYRFKSEVGHQSPLLKTSNEDLHPRASPSGNDPITEADHQVSSEQSSVTNANKHSIKFTPNDYKRDHLIAYMANNNNFNLPKDHDSQLSASGIGAKPSSTTQPRRAQVSNSRLAAQTRARSQSSRRQPTSVSTSSKAEPISKSNQTSPTKTVPPRATTAGRVTSSTTVSRSRTSASTSVGNKLTSTTTKSATSTLNQNGTTKHTTTSSTTRRTATSSVTASRSSSTAPGRIISSARPQTAKPTPSSRAAPRAPISSTATMRVPITSRTTNSRAISSAPRAPINAPKSPTKRTIPSTSSRPVADRTSAFASRQATTTISNRASTTPRGSTSSQNGQSVQSPSNEVKSIKTPKAIASANAKAAAALAAGAVATGVVIAASDSNSLINESTNSNQIPQPEIQPIKREEIQIQHTFAAPQEEQNLIFTTTEAGNMLADEIAQAEKQANEVTTIEQATKQEAQISGEGNMIMQQVSTSTTSVERPPEIADLSEQESVSASEDIEESAPKQLARDISTDSTELINGLAGGLVSTEDRFDSSEHDASLDHLNKSYSELRQQEVEHQQIDVDSQSNDDEPYSIIPAEYEDHEKSHHVEFAEESDDDKAMNQIANSEEHQVDEINQNAPNNNDELLPIDIEGHDRFKTITLISEDRKEGPQERDSSEKDAEFEDQRSGVGSGALEKESQLLRLEEDTRDSKEKSDNQEALDNFRDKFSDDEAEKELKITTDQVSEAQMHDIIDESKIVDNSDQKEVILENGLNNNQSNGTIQDIGESMTASRELDQLHAEECFDDVVKDHTSEKQMGIVQTIETAPTQSISIENNVTTEGKECTTIDNISTADDLFQVEQIDKIEDQQVISSSLEVQPNMEATNQTTLMQSDEMEHVESSNTEPVALSTGDIVVKSNNVQTYTGLSESDKDDYHDEMPKDQHELVGRHNELLMNVADLIDVEGERKQEMARKSEIARLQSSPFPSTHMQQEQNNSPEILLSADQLNEQFAVLSTGPSSNNRAAPTNEIVNIDVVRDEKDKQQQSEHNYESDEIDKASSSQSNDIFANKHEDPSLVEDTVVKTLYPIASTASNITSETDQAKEDFKQIAPGQQLLEQSSESVDDLFNWQSTIRRDSDEKEEEAAKFDREDHQHPASILEDDIKDLAPTEETSQITSVKAGSVEDLLRQESKESVFEKDSIEITGQETVASEEAKIDTGNNQNSNQEFDLSMNLSTSGVNPPEFDREVRSTNADNYDTLTDDMDSDENLKLSNHLTNSDDELILDPRATAAAATASATPTMDSKFSPDRTGSPSRYNEGAGLGLLTHEEQTEVDSAELADGSSAEIVTPTVAEKRVEDASPKLAMPEIPQHAATFIHPPKLIHEEQSDDDDDFVLNPNADPIDVAATMSPSSSVAEELLRLSRENLNPITIESSNSFIDNVQQDAMCIGNSSSGSSSVKIANDNNIHSIHDKDLSQKNSEVATTITITRNESSTESPVSDSGHGESNNNTSNSENNVASKDIDSRNQSHPQTPATEN